MVETDAIFRATVAGVDDVVPVVALLPTTTGSIVRVSPQQQDLWSSLFRKQFVLRTSNQDNHSP